MVHLIESVQDDECSGVGRGLRKEVLDELLLGNPSLVCCIDIVQLAEIFPVRSVLFEKLVRYVADERLGHDFRNLCFDLGRAEEVCSRGGRRRRGVAPNFSDLVHKMLDNM